MCKDFQYREMFSEHVLNVQRCSMRRDVQCGEVFSKQRWSMYRDIQ